jgi:hypothetical protein
MGKYPEAETLYKKALEGRERTLGADHPHTLNTVSNLGGRLKERDRRVDEWFDGNLK